MLYRQKTLNQVQGDGRDRQGDERVDRVPNGGVDRVTTDVGVHTIHNETIFQFNNLSNKHKT